MSAEFCLDSAAIILMVVAENPRLEKRDSAASRIALRASGAFWAMTLINRLIQQRQCLMVTSGVKIGIDRGSESDSDPTKIDRGQSPTLTPTLPPVPAAS
jgi:hypothetical protein